MPTDWRRCVASWAIASALCIAVAGGTEPKVELRVATLNVGLGDFGLDLRSWEARAGELGRLIEELALDVVALQEVWSVDWEACEPEFRDYLASLGITGDHSKLEILRRHLPEGFSVAAELIPSEDRRSVIHGLHWGLAVASRFEIVESDHRRLSIDPADRYPRIVQRARLRLGAEREVELFNVHLSAESERSRLATAAEVVDLARAAPGPLLIAGDLNARPEQAPLQVLFGGFADLWTLAQARVVRSGGAEQPASGSLFAMAASARIDYLLGDAGWLPGRCEIYFDSAVPVTLSDHPLVTCAVSRLESVQSPDPSPRASPVEQTGQYQ